eukprot:gene6610-8180_t
MSYYAVASGYKIGIFGTWDECLESTYKYKGSKFKKFKTLQDAFDYLEKNVEDIYVLDSIKKQNPKYKLSPSNTITSPSLSSNVNNNSINSNNSNRHSNKRKIDEEQQPQHQIHQKQNEEIEEEDYFQDEEFFIQQSPTSTITTVSDPSMTPKSSLSPFLSSSSSSNTTTTTTTTSDTIIQQRPIKKLHLGLPPTISNVNHNNIIIQKKNNDNINENNINSDNNNNTTVVVKQQIPIPSPPTSPHHQKSLIDDDDDSVSSTDIDESIDHAADQLVLEDFKTEPNDIDFDNNSTNTNNIRNTIIIPIKNNSEIDNINYDRFNNDIEVTNGNILENNNNQDNCNIKNNLESIEYQSNKKEDEDIHKPNDSQDSSNLDETDQQQTQSFIKQKISSEEDFSFDYWKERFKYGATNSMTFNSSHWNTGLIYESHIISIKPQVYSLYECDSGALCLPVKVGNTDPHIIETIMLDEIRIKCQ